MLSNPVLFTFIGPHQWEAIDTKDELVNLEHRWDMAANATARTQAKRLVEITGHTLFCAIFRLLGSVTVSPQKRPVRSWLVLVASLRRMLAA